MYSSNENIKVLLRCCLEGLEKRIDEEVETELFSQWGQFVDGKFKGDIFQPKCRENYREFQENDPYAKGAWLNLDIGINETLTDYDKMAFQQFKMCSDSLDRRAKGILCVRCNYGSSIMMSLFGAEIFYMDERHNTLPTSKPLAGGADDVKKLIDRGIPDIYGGFGERVFTMGQYFTDLMKEYPKVNKHVHIYHPDLQGPMDICEVLWGSGLFIDIIDTPDLVHELLKLITETYIKFMKEWFRLIPPKGDYSVQWNMLHKGRIFLRDDSAMNLSPAMFDEFIKPYDQRLLDEFGGGGVHFCGRGDHFIESASKMTGLYAFNPTQPEYNNMEVIYKNTVDKGIKLIGLREQAAQDALKAGRNLRSNVHCL